MEERPDLSQDYFVSHIDEAIEKGYIKVYYQPVIRTISKKLCGMEALARWIDPEKGFVSPAEFIPPLEKSGEIYKLDSYVIEKVCENYSIQYKEDHEPIPVSFNLSRIDFIKTDIFKVVEDNVKKFDVLRDMVNVEITESLFMSDAEKIGREIRRFRDAGYLVWMDDFGSGYSSLNVLKDFEFDELKIDMEFLKKFSERSRDIILSIVYMAKMIGIQTLAEGVETEEQYEFLRKIGCEKIQGYYFGKPLPYAESVSQCTVKGIIHESRSWRTYYDAIGKENFLTDKPIAFVEYDGQKFTSLFSNDHYLSVLKSFGVNSREEGINNVNDSKNSIATAFRKYADSLIVSDKKQETYQYATGKQYARMDVNVIAKRKERAAFEVALYNISGDKDKKTRKKLDKMLRLVLASYDEIFLIDYESNTIEPLISSKGINEFEDFNRDTLHSIERYVERYLYPNDRERNIEFCDKNNVIKNLKEKNTQYLSEYFRMKDANGDYTWKVVSTLLIPDTDYQKFIHCEKKAAIDDVTVVQELLKNFGYTECNVSYRIPKQRSDYMNNAGIFETLMHETNLNYFWKDKERRFLGASDHFLASYGISDVSEIIGKTDEDMNWHIDGVRFKDNEEKIISEGMKFENVPGQCLIKGTVHHIFASKYPLYKDGKIVGLIGVFEDAENYSLRLQTNVHYILYDDVTGLFNSRGLITTLVDYQEQYALNHEDFAILSIRLPGLKRTALTYGRAVVEGTLKKIAEIILKNIKTNGCAGRISENSFIIIYKGDNEIDAVAQNIEREIQEIHTIGGERVTFFAEINIFKAEELSSLDDIFTNIMDAENVQHKKIKICG